MNAPGDRILCIEDNPMNWRLVQRLLSQAGYDMHWADDGIKGCEAAAALKPALILLDINLPGLSGFEVATKLRQNPELAGTLIVALTAKTLRTDRETALVTGCDGFISKPIDPFLFVGQVEAYLGGQRDRLEKGREEPVLRHFSREVVKHLESQLQEAQESNHKLLEAQGQLEQRSRHLSHLLLLSKEIIPIRDGAEIQRRVLRQLREELALARASSYRLHDSGAYYQGLELGTDGFSDKPVLPVDHPLLAWAGSAPAPDILGGGELRQARAWEHGIGLGLWEPRDQALLMSLRDRSGARQINGLLALGRPEAPFQPHEIEIAALYAEILQVSLENADLIAHLDETSQALGSSYQGMESAYEALKQAQAALGTQDRKAMLGGLFQNMAQRFQVPIRILQEESARVSAFMDRPEIPAPEDRAECHHSMAQIRSAISKMDGLVRSLLRRTGGEEAAGPEWIHLHDLLRQELDLLQAEGLLPQDLPVNLNLRAPRDLLYGVYRDFAEVLDHLVAHSLLGRPARLSIRTWGGDSHFRLELEDDGEPIEPGLLETAFEPFLELRAGASQLGRRPGQALPACAQLMQAYGGTVEILPAEQGSLIRLGLPMD